MRDEEASSGWPPGDGVRSLSVVRTGEFLLTLTPSPSWDSASLWELQVQSYSGEAAMGPGELWSPAQASPCEDSWVLSPSSFAK